MITFQCFGCLAPTLSPSLLSYRLSQLPYLDYKHEYLWGALQVSDVTDRKVETIIVDDRNTVRALRDKLLVAVRDGNGDSGLPILQKEETGCKMVGYIGASELEHALSKLPVGQSCYLCSTKVHN